MHKWLHAHQHGKTCRVLAGISMSQPSIKAKHMKVAYTQQLGQACVAKFGGA